MTTAPHISASLAAAKAAPRPPAPRDGVLPATGVVIRWSISPGALLTAPAARALLNGHAAGLASAALELHIDPGAHVTAELLVTLRSGEIDRIPVELPPALARISLDDAYLAIDAPGSLHATFRAAQGQTLSLAYAHTPLLAASLALPGGVYDHPELIQR